GSITTASSNRLGILPRSSMRRPTGAGRQPRLSRCHSSKQVSGKPRAVQRDRLEDLMRHLVRPELLILDEIGYLPLSQEDATFLFEVVNKRYQQARSIILTSNKSFGRWDEFFPDPVLATALLDRLLHHATTVN